LEHNSVKEAVEQGWSWSKIAGALGLSKQAAHKRHAADIVSSENGRQRGEMFRWILHRFRSMKMTSKSFRCDGQANIEGKEAPGAEYSC